MTERKPHNESWESFSERKIREAQQAGAFERLPGLGRPIPDIDEPLDENWWVRKKLRRENLSVLPPLLAARLEAEKTIASIWNLSSEHTVRRKLERLNEKIREAHYSPAPGPAVPLSPIDVDDLIRQWRERKQRAS